MIITHLQNELTYLREILHNLTIFLEHHNTNKSERGGEGVYVVYLLAVMNRFESCWEEKKYTNAY